MTVNSFDPSALNQPIDAGLAGKLCVLAQALDEDTVNLSAADVARFAPLAIHAGWSQVATELDDAQITALIKILTLGEMKYGSWSAGAKSPVVVLVKALKQRGVYQAELGRWVKHHTDNKFLPYGNLMDLL